MRSVQQTVDKVNGRLADATSAAREHFVQPALMREWGLLHKGGDRPEGRFIVTDTARGPHTHFALASVSSADVGLNLASVSAVWRVRTWVSHHVSWRTSAAKARLPAAPCAPARATVH